jgi:hypothetical protein
LKINALVEVFQVTGLLVVSMNYKKSVESGNEKRESKSGYIY